MMNNLANNSIDILNPFNPILDRNRDRKMVFYGRVSTEHEAQLSALQNQMQWYDDQLNYHDNWTLAGRYIDEGITGTQAKKRPAFLQMIEDAKAGKFDLIVTREVCRFARNTVDTLVTTRMLKNIGIEVYFVEDNIWTMDGDGELRLTIMATLAQEESRKTSERVKAGQYISRTKGVIYGSGNILGYDRVDNKYVINPDQGETVRLIFEMYLNTDMGMTKISNELCKMGRRNASGVVKWNASIIARVLSNPTYMGYMAYGKSYSNNYLDQKRINNHNRDSYMYVKADIEPLVTEEEWHECEKKRNRRRKEYVDSRMEEKVSGSHVKSHPKKESRDLWAKKLQCVCGASYRKNRWHKNKNKEWSYGYECYNQINNGSARKRRKQGLDDAGYCDVTMIADWKLKMMSNMLLEQIWTNRKDAVIEACEILKECYAAGRDSDSETVELQNKMNRMKVKIDNLIDLRTEGDISTEEYRIKRKQLDQEIETLEKKLTSCEKKQDISEETLNFEKIQENLDELIDFSSPMMDNVIDKFIAKIVPEGNNKFKWFVNLSCLTTEQVNMVVDGRKNNARVYMGSSSDQTDGDEESPIHNGMICLKLVKQWMEDKKSSPVPMQHRQRSSRSKKDAL